MCICRCSYEDRRALAVRACRSIMISPKEARTLVVDEYQKSGLNSLEQCSLILMVMSRWKFNLSSNVVSTPSATNPARLP